MTEQEMKQEQERLLAFADFSNQVNVETLKYVAGVDVTYNEEHNVSICSIVVVDYRTKDIVEIVNHKSDVQVDYIPGFLAFREIPSLLEAVKKLTVTVDLYIFDGNGYLHPRHMGLATHAGILLDTPSIGVAKNYFSVNGVKFEKPSNKVVGEYVPIVSNDEVLGSAFTTMRKAGPMFVSVGHMVNLETAHEIVKTFCDGQSKVISIIRLADSESRRCISELLEDNV